MPATSRRGSPCREPRSEGRSGVLALVTARSEVPLQAGLGSPCIERSALFIALLDKLSRVYADKKIIHVILDNDVIHTSRITRNAVEAFEGRIVLQLLPPYCPDDNRIERCVWRELHANVTRNHNCGTIDELMDEVRVYLVARNRKAAAPRPTSRGRSVPVHIVAVRSPGRRHYPGRGDWRSSGTRPGWSAARKLRDGAGATPRAWSRFSLRRPSRQNAIATEIRRLHANQLEVGTISHFTDRRRSLLS